MANLLTFPRLAFLFLRLKLTGLLSRFPPLPGGVLDEQTRLFRRAIELLGEAPLDQTTPAASRQEMRNGLRSLRSLGGLVEPVASTRDLTIPSPAGPIPARLYLPGDRPDYPLFLFYHGGGFVIGDLETGDNIARFLCRRGGYAVLSVDYRLAPEHPFPAAVDDCYAALAWAAANAAGLCADPARLFVGGDSAGGTLSAVVAQLCLRNGGPRLSGQALFYPSTDSSSLDTPSFRQFGEASYGLPKRDVEYYLRNYSPDPADHVDPRISPLLAPDLAGLPPALVLTAEFDVLRDEGEAYARRLQEAGVPVRLMRCRGMVHGFLSMLGLIKRSGLYFNQALLELCKLSETVILEPA